MNVKGRYCFSFDDDECKDIHERFFCANEGYIGANEIILSIMKQILIKINVYSV